MHGRTWAVSLAALGLVLAGCGGDDDGGLGGLGADPSPEDVENAIEDAIEDAASDSGDSRDVNVDLDADGDSGEISIEGDDGESISFGGGDLPDGFPDDFPFPDDFEQTLGSGDGESFVVFGASGESVDDLDGFYADALPDAGYTVDDRTEVSSSGANYVTFSFTGNGSTGVVSISTDPANDSSVVNVSIDTAA